MGPQMHMRLGLGEEAGTGLLASETGASAPGKRGQSQTRFRNPGFGDVKRLRLSFVTASPHRAGDCRAAQLDEALGWTGALLEELEARLRTLSGFDAPWLVSVFVVDRTAITARVIRLDWLGFPCQWGQVIVADHVGTEDPMSKSGLQLGGGLLSVCPCLS